MTLDDLFKIYWNGSDFVDGTDGVRRIVAALRDEMETHFKDNYRLDEEDIVTLVAAEAVGVIDEILGAADGSAAGGPTSNDGREATVEAKVVPAPAADVCPSCGKPISFKGPKP